MGMVLGLLPIVGAPLPIMSYGGSSMMAMMIGLGIVMSCKVYKDVPVNLSQILRPKWSKKVKLMLAMLKMR